MIVRRLATTSLQPLFHHTARQSFRTLINDRSRRALSYFVVAAGTVASLVYTQSRPSFTADQPNDLKTSQGIISGSMLHCHAGDAKEMSCCAHKDVKTISVKKVGSAPDTGVPPSHHNPSGTGFINPNLDIIKMLSQSKLPSVKEQVKVKPPDNDGLGTFLATGAYNPSSTSSKSGKPPSLVATWLGHAAVMVTAPGVNVLFDPCWSDRCSPSQLAGPKRLRPTPCKLSELPEVDAVVISHNHYDHLDLNTILMLAGKKEGGPSKGPVWFFVPLGNAKWFKDLGIDTVEVKRSEGLGGKATIACTPCQHFTGRTLWDRNHTLWSSWALKTNGRSFWFGGDTGLRYVPDNTTDEELEKLPRCQRPFDLSAIPIGAYSPREFMSGIHCNPQDAVQVHLDIQSKRSFGIHWGTFVLTDEPINDPPIVLRAALKAKGIKVEGVFDVLEIGETMLVQ
ncbi:beta-lactamase superfamily domain-containing protein [Chytridium lagenaria]|nr:beta-lactamase superfamily domain-containing protein [Chytridium lagenaria]